MTDQALPDRPVTGESTDSHAATDPSWQPETLAVHAGMAPDELTGAVAPPIYQTATFAQEGVGRPRGGWEYARTGNPTRARLEQAVAALESGTHGLAFASGSATTQVIATLALPGERILCVNDVYGGTFRLFERVLRDTGVDATYHDFAGDSGGELDRNLDAKTRLVWLETPTNPHLRVIDIAAIAARLATHVGARGERPVLVVDNTFASPLSQQPLKLGADIVFHSATKYLAGHSDTISGVLATSRDDLFARLSFLQNAIGAVPGPMDCFLVLRGLRTLALRIERHSLNAQAVAALEGGTHGLAFASGSATTQVIATLALPGERILCVNDVYGGTFRLFERVLRDTGVDATYHDFAGDFGGELDRNLDAKTRLVWLETPTNPHLRVIDIAAIAARLATHVGARGERPVLVVDNTFASPLSQQPLKLGADIVFHSATKYLAGHSDTISGVLATSRDDLFARLSFLQNAIGAVPGPMDCFLVLRGLRTLALRIERHSLNAQAVAEALAKRDDLEIVNYPGLRSGHFAHPNAELAARQMRYPGGMLSFVPAARDGRSADERARNFVERTRIFTLAESLGGVESLCEIPAVMTHGSVANSPLEVSTALVRLSVGVEHLDDLVADVTQALDGA